MRPSPASRLLGLALALALTVGGLALWYTQFRAGWNDGEPDDVVTVAGITLLVLGAVSVVRWACVALRGRR